MMTREQKVALLLAAVLAVARGFVVPRTHGPRTRRASTPPQLLEVCQNKHCRKRGAAKTLQRLQELSVTTKVLVADMSHTEHGCFDECTMGPNVRVDGVPGTDKGRVVNGVKSEDHVRQLLGLGDDSA